MSDALVVDLHPVTPEGRDAVIKSIMLLIPAARSVTRLETISRGTLDAMLLPQSETWEAVRGAILGHPKGLQTKNRQTG